MHPLLDTTDLTDDQITEKLKKAYQYSAMQGQLGHASAVDSINATITALELEKELRFAKMLNDEAEKQNPNANDPLDVGVMGEVKDYDENW